MRAGVECGSPSSLAVGPRDGFSPRGNSGSTVLGRVPSAGFSSLCHRCGPKIPRGLRAIRQLLNGEGWLRMSEALAAAPRGAGPCPPRGWEPGCCVTLAGRPGSPCQDIPAAESWPGCHPAPTTLDRGCCWLPAAAQACGAAGLPNAFPAPSQPPPGTPGILPANPSLH